ncbi:MAG: hypothetical protein Q8P95_00395 [bacterium]|nr:hypothetical protein [bacterium]
MADASRNDLEREIKQMAMLSIGLKVEEKDQLIRTLPGLSDEQLSQLKSVFEQENQRKEKILSDFFSKNPQLFPEFERLTSQQVNSIYLEAETEEKAREEQRMQALLQAEF